MSVLARYRSGSPSISYGMLNVVLKKPTYLIRKESLSLSAFIVVNLWGDAI